MALAIETKPSPNHLRDEPVEGAVEGFFIYEHLPNIKLISMLSSFFSIFYHILNLIALKLI
jgi:hypothetical protein